MNGFPRLYDPKREAEPGEDDSDVPPGDDILEGVVNRVHREMAKKYHLIGAVQSRQWQPSTITANACVNS
jgi:hypothetical protein